jgi:hypothetical protein
MAVVSLFVSRSLPSNGSTRYIICTLIICLFTHVNVPMCLFIHSYLQTRICLSIRVDLYLSGYLCLYYFLLFLAGWDWGHYWRILPAPDDRWWWLWSNSWNEDWQGKPKYSEKKTAPMPLCPPQMPHDFSWDRTRTAAVGSQRLTAWAMARPLCVCMSGLTSTHAPMCRGFYSCIVFGKYPLRIGLSKEI